ncbi:hypothetical protein LEP1GSC199_0788 [Leptospira vanthielii serovar Holland str. Waz Holland = ATCC 700522]|uniref:Uncharacterized protein n=1 Tax=Leptospira vanthielii serovar Holland str. Waz Holland = ATCC 700522 TaxID=1218591 RepID=N1W2L0_9LEPT|nr:hypothetical protein LEP1GSC199_0788 [Leptospira vanthielii serovar Holland str. Waz Holland = ATCC 700522]
MAFYVLCAILYLVSYYILFLPTSALNRTFGKLKYLMFIVWDRFEAPLVFKKMGTKQSEFEPT